MKTTVTEMLGIDVPILAFSHCRDVVAEVSKAGGLGVLGAVAHTPEQLEIDLGWIKNQVGARPSGADPFTPARTAGDDQGGYSLDDIRGLIPAAHVEFVNDILRRYEVPALPEADADDPGREGWQTSGGEAPFSANRAGPQLDIALGHRTAFVANALGPPPPEMIERVKQEGRIVAALAGRAVHAERHAAAGVDVIIAQGSEAGGRPGAGARCRRHRAGPPDGRGHGPRRTGRLVRLGVAHHRRGRDPPDGQGQDARRHVGRHDPVAVAHRQARPHVALGVDRRVGA